MRSLIAAGEGYYVELKSCWAYGPDGKIPRDIKSVAADIGEAIVAFANADGGDLLVGVEDSGAVTGVPWDGDKLNYLVQAPHHQVKEGSRVGVTVHDLVIDGHRVLLFRVPEHGVGEEGEPLVTSAGRCLVRRSAASEPASPDEIKRRRRHRRGDTTYEAELVPNATVEDISLPDSIFTAARHLDKLKGRPLEVLRYWNLVDSRNGHAVLRRAALLLFATEPLRWHPNNRVRIRRVHGDQPGIGRQLRTQEREVPGPVVTLLPLATSILNRALEAEARQEQLFSTTQLLPRDAVEECLVNAVAHRNYAAEGSAIEILLFPDRVEFHSPGGLPEPLTIDDLRLQKGIHRSRNPLIMRVLRELGWSRDQGEGMRRIFGAMTQVELHEPELEERADTFIVRLSTRSLYDEETQSWIAAYGPFGLEPDERKYMVALRASALSSDRLARRIGVNFDVAKKRLTRLEDKGLVWHATKSRTYRLVEPLVVPQERALRLLQKHHVRIAADTTIERHHQPRSSTCHRAPGRPAGDAVSSRACARTRAGSDPAGARRRPPERGCRFPSTPWRRRGSDGRLPAHAHARTPGPSQRGERAPRRGGGRRLTPAPLGVGVVAPKARDPGRAPAERLAVRAPFHLDATVRVLQRRPANPVDVWEGERYLRVLETDEGLALVAVANHGSLDAPDLRCRVVEGRLSAAARAAVTGTLRRVLGLDVDPDPLQRLAEVNGRLGPTVAALRGLRPPRYPGLFETFANVVPFQQVSLDAGAAIVRRLVERFGRPLWHAGRRYHAFPRTSAIAGARLDAIRACGLSQRKAETLQTLAVAVAGGQLDEAPLEAMNSDEALRFLTGLRGIGPWSAGLVLLRGFGRLDVFPAGDVGVARGLGRLLGSAGASPAALDRLVARAGHARGYLYFCALGAALLEAGLIHAAPRAP